MELVITFGFSVSNCYNTGTISGSSRKGSIIGQCTGSSFANCWWTSSNAGSGLGGSSSNSKKVTEDVLKGYASNLGEEYFCEDVNNINDGFPILRWELED